MQAILMTAMTGGTSTLAWRNVMPGMDLLNQTPACKTAIRSEISIEQSGECSTCCWKVTRTGKSIGHAGNVRVNETTTTCNRIRWAPPCHNARRPLPVVGDWSKWIRNTVQRTQILPGSMRMRRAPRTHDSGIMFNYPIRNPFHQAHETIDGFSRYWLAQNRHRWLRDVCRATGAGRASLKPKLRSKPQLEMT
jgi:hypothetical protein